MRFVGFAWVKQISIPIAVVLRCPFKISSTAVAVYLHRPMQYICSEKPMRCLDKVTALHPLTHRIVFAHAPHCVFSFTSHLSVFLSCWTCFSICPRWCSRNGSLWDPETSSGWHLCIPRSSLTAHYSLLKNLSYLCHLCAIVFICQKTRKGD